MTALAARPSFYRRWRKRLLALIVTGALFGLGLPATGLLCVLFKASDTSVIIESTNFFRKLCRCTYSHCVPPDETIIAHYEKHKATFDDVVRRIRWEWGAPEYGRTTHGVTRRGYAKYSTPLDAVVDFQGTWPAPPPAGFPTNIREFEPKCKACNQIIRFGFGVFDKGSMRFTQYMYVMAYVTKEIVFFPYEPMVKDGRLTSPNGFDLGVSSAFEANLDVVKLPEHLGECSYRRLEAAVFLRLCVI